jgi:hypothetical protein
LAIRDHQLMKPPMNMTVRVTTMMAATAINA